MKKTFFSDSAVGLKKNISIEEDEKAQVACKLF